MAVHRWAVILIAGALPVLLSCNPPMSQEGTNVALLSRMFEYVDAGRFDLFTELCAPRYAYHAAGGAEPMSCADHRRVIRTFQRAFTDGGHTLDDVFAAGDKVVFRRTDFGVHTGPFLGIPATGNQVRYRTIGVVQFANGQMLNMWLDRDWPTLLDQLGTTPPAWHRRWADRLFEPLPPAAAEPG